MDVQQRIDEARRRFAMSLVGRWSTAVGTWSAAIDQVWEIRLDGTGTFTDTGPFGQPKGETHFEWRQPAEGTFELRLLRYVAVPPWGGMELTDEEREWQTIRYDFVAVSTDLSIEIGLVDRAQAGRRDAGFLDSGAPLAYRGPVESQGASE